MVRIRNKVKKYFYGFLLTWLIVATYLAWENPKIQYIYSFVKPNKNDTKLKNHDIELERSVVDQFINTYYPFTPESNPNEIIKTLKPLVSENKHTDILTSYKENLAFLKSKAATRNIEVLKVLFLKESSAYLAYIDIKQKLEGSKTFPYTLKLKLSVKPSDQNKSKYEISDIEESILTEPKNIFQDQSLYIEPNVFTKVNLPCASNAISTDSKEEVEYKVSPNGKRVSFIPSSEVKKEVIYIADCGRRSFKLKLNSAKDVATLYQKLGLKDGVYRPRKLTEDEQTVKDLEEQFGGIVE